MKKQTLKYGFLMALTLGGSASLAQDPAQTLKDLIKKVQPTPPAKGATTAVAAAQPKAEPLKPAAKPQVVAAKPAPKPPEITRFGQ